MIEANEITDPHHDELRDIAKRLRFRQGNPSVRQIAHHAALSAATVSRVLAGPNLPTWDSVLQVIRALNGSDADLRRCRAAWVAANHNAAVARQARRTLVNPSAVAGEVVIHDGTVFIDTAAITAGKEIVVNGGTVHVNTAAAKAAARIVVNGGTIHLGGGDELIHLDDVSQSPRSEHLVGGNAGAPNHQSHLRRVQ
ncbi:hypothetical protein AB0N23_23395 [Streptomyces sp. NPDC052644]